MSDSRVRRVAFADARLLGAFNELKAGRFEDKQLAAEIDATMDMLKQDPLCGTKIGRDLWPKEYVKKYGIDNLRKCDMRSGWRIMYTLKGNKIEIVSILLEWLDHKGYERRFGYKSR